jgi:hypothetical protein
MSDVSAVNYRNNESKEIVTNIQKSRIVYTRDAFSVQSIDALHRVLIFCEVQFIDDRDENGS